MGLRESVASRPGIAGGVAVVLIVLAIWRPWGGGSQGPGRWYYDLTTGELVVVRHVKATQPITLPTGNPGVMAHVFGCGGCEPDQRFIGYLQRINVQGAQNPGEEVSQTEPTPVTVSIEVAAVPKKGEQPVWVPMTSPKAAPIVNVSGRCPGKSATLCFPD